MVLLKSNTCGHRQRPELAAGEIPIARRSSSGWVVPHPKTPFLDRCSNSRKFQHPRLLHIHDPVRLQDSLFLPLDQQVTGFFGPWMGRRVSPRPSPALLTSPHGEPGPILRSVSGITPEAQTSHGHPLVHFSPPPAPIRMLHHSTVAWPRPCPHLLSHSVTRATTTVPLSLT